MHSHQGRGSQRSVSRCPVRFPWVRCIHFNLRQRQHTWGGTCPRRIPQWSALHTASDRASPHAALGCAGGGGAAEARGSPGLNISGWLHRDLCLFAVATISTFPSAKSPAESTAAEAAEFLPAPRCPGRLPPLLCQAPQPCSLMPSHGPGASAPCPSGIWGGHPALPSPLLLQGCPQRGLSLPSRSLDATF